MASRVEAPITYSGAAGGAAGGAGGIAAGCSGAACGVDCGEGASMLSYVGEGQGDWIQETSYQYVGKGAGQYDVVAVGGGYNWCFIGSGVCGVLTLLVLLVFLLWPTGGSPVDTTTPKYDCNAGFGNWQNGWSIGKKAFCCDRVGRGCPRPPPPPPPAPTSAPVVPTPAPAPQPTQPPPPVVTTPNMCNQGGVHEWTVEKRAYCCKHFNNGCDTPEPSPVPTALPPYDCVAGFQNWVAGWSVGKKAWCCQHQGKGCPQTTGGCATSAPYDCAAGFGNWVAGWSVAKKEWCCKNAGKGCPPQAGGCP